MKTNKHMIPLFEIGGVFGILSWVVDGTAKNWMAAVSGLALAAGLAVFLADTVADRKALEARRKP